MRDYITPKIALLPALSEETIEIKKEFELERMILFSDAVFGIAITLLIIEIKFPEFHKGASSSDLLISFKPVIIRFLAFILSFFFIGMNWAQHLRIFKYLQTYNTGLIIRNLVFIFFIVCFPFTASGITENLTNGFLLPFWMYFINIMLVFASNFFFVLLPVCKKNLLMRSRFRRRKEIYPGEK